MDKEKVFIAYSFLQLHFMYKILMKRKKSKRWIHRKWLVRPINTRRMLQDDLHHLFQEMKEDADLFFRYTRMDVNTFNILLIILLPYLSLKSPKALPPEQRLAITLRYNCF